MFEWNSVIKRCFLPRTYNIACYKSVLIHIHVYLFRRVPGWLYAMIPSFTVTNSVNYQSSSSAMGTNPIYWIRQSHTENGGTRTHKVSTKILGFGIFMIGVILLTIGLILGLQFPNYVSEKIRRDMCIFDRKHIFFDSWVSESYFFKRRNLG